MDSLKPSGPSIFALADGADPRDREVAARIRATVQRLRAVPGVAEVSDPVTTPARELVARDGRAALIVVEFAPHLPDSRFDPALKAAVTELRRIGTPHVLVGGGPLQDSEFEDQVQTDLSHAEMFSLPVVLVLLLVVFGGIVAAGLPVLIAPLGVAGSLLALLGISSLTEVSVYSVNVVTMLGLGLAVDYALLLVSRFREERTRHDLSGAIEATVATAGRTVVFSSLTVAASLAGLLVFPDPFLHARYQPRRPLPARRCRVTRAVRDRRGPLPGRRVDRAHHGRGRRPRRQSRAGRGPGHHEADGPLELVGSSSAAAPPRAHRPARARRCSRPAGPDPRHRARSRRPAHRRGREAGRTDCGPPLSDLRLRASVVAHRSTRPEVMPACRARFTRT